MVAIAMSTAATATTCSLVIRHRLGVRVQVIVRGPGADCKHRRRAGLPLRVRAAFVLARSSHPLRANLHQPPMNALQFVVEGGHTLSGTIRPSGNKNAALPIICGALLTDQPVMLENVPRIRDVETLVELVSSVGVDVAWTGQNTLRIHAQTVKAGQLDPKLCRRIRASILLAGPLLARSGEIELPPPGGDVIGRRRVDTHFLALERLGVAFDLDESFHLSTPELRGADV